jgi:NAD(P)-dependent dehydrogenase (short-subunit alcohol dehydrogenase family)
MDAFFPKSTTGAMASLADVRAHNLTLKTLAPGLVAIFVGGTSGISLYTAREFARNTKSPHIYLIGRNETEAARISQELQTINATSRIDFIKKDVSLLRQVDEACNEIKAKEKKINLLFMTIGTLTFQGRTETEEGLDRKFALHYYARMRFVQNLTPLLAAAAARTNVTDPSAPTTPLSRVVSVYDPFIGNTKPLNFSDLSLKTNFTLGNCAQHASAMQNFALERFARLYPQTSFIHEQPGMVETGLSKNWMFKPMYFMLRPLTVGKVESGERHLFAATAPRYAPKARAAGEEGVVVGANGVVGSGSYSLRWSGEANEGSKMAKEMRDAGAEEKIWEHTEEVFGKICDEGGKY